MELLTLTGSRLVRVRDERGEVLSARDLEVVPGPGAGRPRGKD